MLFSAVSFSNASYFHWERGHFSCLITACAAFYSEPEIHPFRRQRPKPTGVTFQLYWGAYTLSRCRFHPGCIMMPLLHPLQNISLA